MQVDAQNPVLTSSVIKQKGESQNGYFKKTKHAKFSGKRTFLAPWYAHVGAFCLITDDLILCYFWKKHHDFHESLWQQNDAT